MISTYVFSTTVIWNCFRPSPSWNGSSNTPFPTRVDCFLTETRKMLIWEYSTESATLYRSGHGFKSRTGLNFFRPYFHYCLSSAHYCEDHFHSGLYPQFKCMTFIYSRPFKIVCICCIQSW